MAIELTPASAEEILEFKQAAAARYAERGISPAQASAAFDAYMAKLGARFGVVAPPSDKVVKLAGAIMDNLNAAKAKAKGAIGAVKAKVHEATAPAKAPAPAAKTPPKAKTPSPGAKKLAEQMKEVMCKAKVKAKAKKPAAKK